MNAGSILHDRYALFDTEGSFYSMQEYNHIESVQFTWHVLVGTLPAYSTGN